MQWYDSYLHARDNAVRCAIIDDEKDDEECIDTSSYYDDFDSYPAFTHGFD